MLGRKENQGKGTENDRWSGKAAPRSDFGAEGKEMRRIKMLKSRQRKDTRMWGGPGCLRVVRVTRVTAEQGEEGQDCLGMGVQRETGLHRTLQTAVRALELTSECTRKPLEGCEQGLVCRVCFVKISLANTEH